MFDIDAKEVVELFPFAARRVVTCEVVEGKSDPMGISVEEMLAVGRETHRRPLFMRATFGTPVWAFCTSKGGVMSNYTMSAEMKVAEARSLRNAEMG